MIRKMIPHYPKVVARLQVLTVLSFVWSTAFTLLVWGMVVPNVWTGLVVGHIAIIFAMYYTFKQFHDIKSGKLNYIFPQLT